ncbi:MAG TPA: DUF397 domain-containing protein [Actinocrinis sp.]|nr:DUF397 domain-containing protein [Actinocrinis sp.]
MNPNKNGWIASSKCDAGNECVEVRFADGTAQVRSSRRPNGFMLVFDRAEWEAFLRGVADGEFRMPR